MPNSVSVDNGSRLMPLDKVSETELLKQQKEYEELQVRLKEQRIVAIEKAKMFEEKGRIDREKTEDKRRAMPDLVSINGVTYDRSLCEQVDGMWRLIPPVLTPVIEPVVDKVEEEIAVIEAIEEVVAPKKRTRRKKAE